MELGSDRLRKLFPNPARDRWLRILRGPGSHCFGLFPGTLPVSLPVSSKSAESADLRGLSRPTPRASSLDWPKLLLIAE